jgi:hypothetical protein
MGKPMNTPDALHWNQNKLRWKVDAELAELAPLTYKFAIRSCVGIFQNERT